MPHPTVTFTGPTHERVTRRIAGAYEARQQARCSFYSPTRWADLPQECQQEHADIAAAALSNTTYNGHELPQWVRDIANTEKKGTP